MTAPPTPVRTVHLVGNAHIDPVWLWRFPEGLQEARATFWSAIHRIAETPEFVFTCDQVALLAWVEQTDPALFAEIGRCVAAGRWVNVGGWWVEPDCNVPGGESFCRQGLQGQRFLLSRFGVAASVGLNADPFGHNATIPQILVKQGMAAYCFLRPGPHEQQLPDSPFWWESPDGSRVLAYRIPHAYCGPGEDVAAHLSTALALVGDGEPEAMVFYGVGNHGGGPTRANLASIQTLGASGEYGQLLLSSPVDYFAGVRGRGRELPVWRGELQHHAAGCYSAHSGVKTWMRAAETALSTAERWASVAAGVAGLPYPRSALTAAWQTTLFNQFHDVLPGSSIEPAYDDARDQLGGARAAAVLAQTRALHAIARDVAIPDAADTVPVLVFNPHPFPVRADVEVEGRLFAGPLVAEAGADAAPESAGPNGAGAAPADAAGTSGPAVGTPVPVQPIRADATVRDAARRRVVFAAQVPGLGYRCYRLRRADPADPVDSGGLLATDTLLANDQLRAELDPATGQLNHLVLLDPGVDLVAGTAGPHTVVAEDRSDTWGHDVVSYAQQGRPFRCESVRLVEAGPARAVLRVTSTFGASRLVEDWILSRDARHLAIRVELDWQEHLALLKYRFPTALADPVATFEIPYGFIRRPAGGGEEPGQRWVDVSGTVAGVRAGLAVVTDTKHGYDVSGGSIGVTAVRSPVYAWHNPQPLEPDGTYRYQDQGRQRFTVLLVPHGGDWRDSGLTSLAELLVAPPVAMFESFHDGPLPAARSFAAVEPETVVLGALKLAEDDDAHVVVRLVEMAGRPTRARLALPFLGRELTADLAPHEIATLLVPVDPAAAAVPVDLLERPV